MKREDHFYDDLLYLPHPVSRTRRPMSRQERAAQFSPFAALTGYDAVLREAGRRTDARADLTESGQAELDEALRALLAELDRQPEAAVTWFVPDPRKPGGTYVRTEGRVKKLDEYARCITLIDGTEIPIGQIVGVMLR